MEDDIKLGGGEDGETIPFDDSPIPFNDSDEKEGSAVSYTPLDLGGGRSEAKVVSKERITGVKTFFTKLHAGSIAFLDTQITEWLKKNPGVVVKRTNTVTGLLVGKKTEPSIVVTIWY